MALVAACATADGPWRQESTEPPVFAGVRKVALVRSDDATQRAPSRPKDPLDGLGESLGVRGVATRVVETGADGGEATRALEQLKGEIEGHVRAAAPGVDRRRTAQPLGSGAATVVRDLGVDALALYLRLDRPGALAPVPPAPRPYADPPLPGIPGAESTYRPVAAIALVARDGRLVWVDWGPRDEVVDPPGPANAVEALDEAIRLLTGEPPPDGA